VISVEQPWGFTFTPASQIASVTRTNDAYAWTAHFNVSRPYSVNGITVNYGNFGGNFGDTCNNP
jgi:hypothetical protein